MSGVHSSQWLRKLDCENEPGVQEWQTDQGWVEVTSGGLWAPSSLDWRWTDSQTRQMRVCLDYDVLRQHYYMQWKRWEPDRWRYALERRRMNVSRSKTENMHVHERQTGTTIKTQQAVKCRKHPQQCTVQKRGGSVWRGWRRASGWQQQQEGMGLMHAQSRSADPVHLDFCDISIRHHETRWAWVNWSLSANSMTCSFHPYRQLHIQFTQL